MERRFEIRKREILQQGQINPQVFNGMLKRLEQFAQPFINSLRRREQKEHVHTYIAGLLSDLKRKNVESIAYRHDQDRRGLQRFIGSTPWDHRPLLQELARQVGSELGQDDGVIVFDPSGHKKCGNDSVGVQRQWLGRLGKVDNGQVGIYPDESGPLARSTPWWIPVFIFPSSGPKIRPAERNVVCRRTSAIKPDTIWPWIC